MGIIGQLAENDSKIEAPRTQTHVIYSQYDPLKLTTCQNARRYFHSSIPKQNVGVQVSFLHHKIFLRVLFSSNEILLRSVNTMR